MCAAGEGRRRANHVPLPLPSRLALVCIERRIAAMEHTTYRRPDEEIRKPWTELRRSKRTDSHTLTSTAGNVNPVCVPLAALGYV